MKGTRLLAALVFGGLVSFGLVLYATEDHPSALFKEFCAKCHGEDGKADTPKDATVRPTETSAARKRRPMK